MHVVHLGLLFVCNGSALKLGQLVHSVHFPTFYVFQISLICRRRLFKSLILASCISPRNLLVRAGCFGDDNVGKSVKLARAYVAFKRFISEKKITCSQPEFTEGMASGLCLFVGFVCRSIYFVCVCTFVCLHVGGLLVHWLLARLRDYLLTCLDGRLPLPWLVCLLFDFD